MFDQGGTKKSVYHSTELPQPDNSLHSFQNIRTYIRGGKISWSKITDRRHLKLVNSDLVSREDAGERDGKPFPLHDNYFLSKSKFHAAIVSCFSAENSENAINALRQCDPQNSAHKILSNSQMIIGFLLIAGVIASAATAPLTTAIAINAFITLYFVSAIFFRVVLLCFSTPQNTHTPISSSDPDLPVITILLPLYKDAASLALLVKSIQSLDYPAKKLDVKLLLECGDHETIDEAHRLDLDTLFDIIEVPNSSPQTKPKACNYGLQLARGDYVVIYDAEDQPEPDQLLKAVAAFRDGDETLACVQARLNFYNRNENWLTQLFTLEYSLWFDWLLCALERIGAPIPLGGTSNFIKTDILIEQGGWDAFNVTEDADLGLRLSKRGYKTALLDSTTYEEANCTLNNWVRQRSRWLKGYLQTWLVHMRRPDEIIKTTGWTGFLSIQLLLAGNVFSAIVNPAMWLIFLSWLAFKPDMISAIFPEPLLQMNLFAFFIGNFVFIALMIIAPLRRGWWTLTAAGITAPFYWLITSIAGYMAVWQLLTKPFYWEKTDHMLSSVAQKQREELLAKGTP